MLTPEEIIWGYRFILGRDPENGQVIEQKLKAHSTWRALREALLDSPEFKKKNWKFHKKSKWVATDIFGGKLRIWLDLADDYVSSGCLQDRYEPAETSLVRQHLKPGGVFLDIGANIGWFSLLASTLVGEQGKIFAFEPRRPTVDYLRRSVADNNLGSRIAVYDFGLDIISGKRFLAWDAETRNPGHSEITDEPVSAGKQTIPVEVRQLDELKLGHVDFIKIDVEGSEMRSVKGAVRTIEKYRPIILSEIYPAQLQKVSNTTANEYLSWFRRRGYRSFVVGPDSIGEELLEYPTRWPKELMNVIYLPR